MKCKRCGAILPDDYTGIVYCKHCIELLEKGKKVVEINPETGEWDL